MTLILAPIRILADAPDFQEQYADVLEVLLLPQLLLGVPFCEIEITIVEP
jgi:hypothetical protein